MDFRSVRFYLWIVYPAVFRLSVVLIADRRHPQCDLTALIRFNFLDSLFEYLKQTA